MVSPIARFTHYSHIYGYSDPVSGFILSHTIDFVGLSEYF